MGMNRSHTILANCLAAGLFGAAWAWADVGPGVSREVVVRELGQPEQMIRINDRQIWYYERGRVDLEGSVVVNAELVSEEEAVVRRERLERERREREQAERERREARLARGLLIQEEKLGDALFLAEPTAKRLAFWRTFKRNYPEVPLAEDYYAALEERQDELRQRESENRLAALERKIDEAERRLAETEAEAQRRADEVRRHSASYYYPNQVAVVPVHYDDHHGRHRARRVRVHSGGHAQVTVKPFKGTAGYAFQRSHEELSNPTHPVRYSTQPVTVTSGMGSTVGYGSRSTFRRGH